MENVDLNFEISEEQLETLQIHAALKQNGVFRILLDEPNIKTFDKVQIWFSCSYNDYTHDVNACYADLITNDKVIKKIPLTYGMNEITINDYDGPNEVLRSYTVKPNML